MGRRQIIMPYTTIAGTSMASSITGPATYIQNVDGCAYQASWTGTPTGSFDIQVSVDQVSWNSLTFSNASGPVTFAAAGSAGTFFADITITKAPYIRLVYTRSSGTGALTAIITSATVGA